MNRHDEKQISMLETSTGTKQERIVASVERARFDFSFSAFVSHRIRSASIPSGDFVCVLASDGFFPFADGIDEAVKVRGIKHISQVCVSPRCVVVVRFLFSKRISPEDLFATATWLMLATSLLIVCCVFVVLFIVVQIRIDHVHDGNKNFLPLNQRDLFASKNTLQKKRELKFSSFFPPF